MENPIHRPQRGTASRWRENRRAELFFFRGPVTPPPVDPCPAGGCAEYPEWVRRTIRTIDVNSEPEVTVLIVDEIGLPLINVEVQLALADGTRETISTDGNGLIRTVTRSPGTAVVQVVRNGWKVFEGFTP